MSKQKNRLLLGVACAVIAAMAILVPLMVENTYATFWALVPPVVAIGLALITKEVYSSLFVGIVVGGAFACGGSIPAAVDNVVGVGLVNLSQESYTIQPGDRIAQLMVVPVVQPDITLTDTLDETERGTGGFGSTGR